VLRAENDKDIYLVFEFMETDLHAVIRANILEDVSGGGVSGGAGARGGRAPQRGRAGENAVPAAASGQQPPQQESWIDSLPVPAPCPLPPLPKVHKQYVMYQLFRALKYVHSAQLLHRDIKVRRGLGWECGGRGLQGAARLLVQT
jgi:serine/threonine protein kinase